jgi:hypothetical protein
MDSERQPPTDAAPAHGAAAELQRSVQRKLGRCLIRLQQYERLLKTVIAHREVAGSTAEKVEAHRTGRMQDSATKTLGHLVGQLTSKYIAAEGTPADGDDEPDELSMTGVFIRTTHRIEMSPEDYATTERRLRELVDLRNELVHHFIERFDLWALDGGQAASEFLDASYARIDEDFIRLRGWADTADQARVLLAGFLASDEFQRVLVEDFQSGHGLPLPAGSVVELLRSAAITQATDGWANLEAAVATITTSAPDESPAKYGCSNWRHLLHASGQFEIRRIAGTGALLPRTLFRVRTPRPRTL